METRSGKYGRYLGEVIDSVVNSIPEEIREEYRERLLKELEDYNGNVHELEGENRPDIEDPEQVARIVKEGLHLMYQKDTSNRALESIVERLEEN